ncbi:protein MTSS 1-like [Rhincodon typus]|uniref:protein MTSS 1-like n=1 Tax=Rhincodon typus TaxID=259920 RepID=UPI00202E9DA9|nr:protein MTSS 1-like [Rhincodon typus]
MKKISDVSDFVSGATKEIGSALTRMCMRHRSIESRLKQLTTALTDSLINPLEGRIEEWKKIANQLDKDHAKEYKKARQEIKKKSSDTLKLQKKVKKVPFPPSKPIPENNWKLLGRLPLWATCNARLVVIPGTKQMVFDRLPWDLSHLLLIRVKLDVSDLKTCPNYSMSAVASCQSEAACCSGYSVVVNGLSVCGYYCEKSSGSDPVPDWAKLAPIEQLQINSLQPNEAAAYQMVGENGAQAPVEAGVYTQAMERVQSTAGSAAYKPQVGEMSAREHLALTLSQGMNVDTQRSSRDSLHCSSGYSTQTTTPSCSEDTIPSQAVKKEQSLVVPDYDYLSLHGEQELPDQIDFDKSSTIPRNSDISLNYRKMFQAKRPASTVSLLVDPEPMMTSHVATIRRKPSSKPTFRRGTISGVPIPIRTPMVPIPGPPVASKPIGLAVSRTGSEECVSLHGGRSNFVQRKQGICSSTQSLSMAQTPGYFLLPEKPLQVSGLQRSAPNLQNARELMPATNNTGNGVTPHLGPAEDSQRTAGVHTVAATPSPTEGGDDVLSMIRRGVKLRKTLTNDRSAPRIV